MYKSGLLEEECPCLCAGADYADPWTRDAAINVWNGVGLLFPEVARSTLLSMLIRTPGGPTISGQYWDKIVWTLGAWHYYLYTGDRAFLALAFDASGNTLAALERDEFDPVCRLFRGPAVYGDGVSAYPPLYTNTGEYTGGEWVSTITKWVSANPSLRAHPGFGLPMHTLSTNCLYYAVYTTMPRMARELNAPHNGVWETMASSLREAINREFRDNTTGRYRYLVDPNGNLILRRVWGWPSRCCSALPRTSNARRYFGIPGSVRPEYPASGHRSNATSISRAPAMDATAAPSGRSFRPSGVMLPRCTGRPASSRTNWTATAHAWRDKQFVEVYRPDTGLPYGGVQESNSEKWHEWKSCDRQSWSASGYLRLVLMGLFGMRFDTDGIRFQPCLPSGSGCIHLQRLPYRDASWMWRSPEAEGRSYRPASMAP